MGNKNTKNIEMSNNQTDLDDYVSVEQISTLKLIWIKIDPLILCRVICYSESRSFSSAK